MENEISIHKKQAGTLKVGESQSTEPTGTSWAYLEGNVASGAVFEFIEDTPNVRTGYTQIYQATGRKDLPG